MTTPATDLHNLSRIGRNAIARRRVSSAAVPQSRWRPRSPFQGYSRREGER